MTRTLGDTEVYPIGLGEMPLSLASRPDEAQAIRTIHAAIDAGVTLIDTADAYAKDGSDVGHGERLIAKALKEIDRDDIIVATKGGHLRDADGNWPIDGRPEHIKAACEASLKALGTDRIDLYQHHRPDPNVPYAETIGALKELLDEGKVRWVGISNANVDQINEALSIAPIVSVQNELSLKFTQPLTNGEVALCTEKGLAFLPWSPLGGIGNAEETSGGVNAVAEAAGEHGVSPQQVVLAWLLFQSPTMIPIPGSSRPETIADSAGAAGLQLSEDELTAISTAAGI